MLLKYTDKVYFLPSIGMQYNLGLRVVNGDLCFGTQNLPGKKILIIGREHYCLQDRIDNTNAKKRLFYKLPSPLLGKEQICNFQQNGRCNKLFHCKFFTQEMIRNHQLAGRLGLKSKVACARFHRTAMCYPDIIASCTHFEDALFSNKTNQLPTWKLWDYVGFFNYFQEPMKKQQGNPLGLSQEAVAALSEVLYTQEPEIMIVWGLRKENPPVFTSLKTQLTPTAIGIYEDYACGKFYLRLFADKELPYFILDELKVNVTLCTYQGHSAKHHVPMVFIHHPGTGMASKWGHVVREVIDKSTSLVQYLQQVPQHRQKGSSQEIVFP